jgi:hypothetical protein
MNDALLKVCPKCHMLTELSALRCGNCSHLFRDRRSDLPAPETSPECCSAEQPRASSASFVWIGAAVRTVVLLAIAVLLGMSAVLAGRADSTGLRSACEIVGFFTSAGALCSAADFLAALPRTYGLDDGRGAKPPTWACVPSTR